MADHVEVLREMFAECANDRRMKEAYALEAAIRALSPAGGDWVMVPRMLTQEMREVLTVMLTKCHTVDESYSDLIAAAPRPQPDRMASMIEHGMSAIDWTPVRAAASPQPLPDIDALLPSLGTDDPAFSAWRDSVPDKHWAKMDLSALRIGYELGKLSAAPQPQDRPYPECSGDPMGCPENEGFGCCKTVAPPARGDVNDPSGQTLAGAGGVSNEQAVKARRPILEALSDAYRAGRHGNHFNTGFRAWRVLDAVAAALTATSAGTTGDAEDAAKRERAIRSAVIKGLADLVGLHEPEAVRKRLGHHWLNEMIERERVVDIVLRVKREIEEAAPHVDAARRAREVGDASRMS